MSIGVQSFANQQFITNANNFNFHVQCRSLRTSEYPKAMHSFMLFAAFHNEELMAFPIFSYSDTISGILFSASVAHLPQNPCWV